MSEDIKSLIAKINEEGVKAAETKAAAVEAAARQEAEELIAKAKKEAALLIRQAEAKNSGLEEKTRALLAQAARDVLLGLHKEVNTALGRVIMEEVRKQLSPELLAGLLKELILKEAGASPQDIIINVSAHDFKALEQGLLAKLKQELKKGVTLRPSEAVRAGFTISFDAGKSQFDFSDKALAEYISTHLKPNLKKVLDEAVS